MDIKELCFSLSEKNGTSGDETEACKYAKELLSDSKIQVQNLFEVDPAEYVIVAESGDQTLVSGMNTMIAQFLTKE